MRSLPGTPSRGIETPSAIAPGKDPVSPLRPWRRASRCPVVLVRVTDAGAAPAIGVECRGIARVLVTSRVLERCTAVAQRPFRAGVPGDAGRVCAAARVPGGALLRSRTTTAHFLIEAQGQGAPGERHEESRGAVCAVREPGVRARGAGPGGSVPSCGETHADRGQAGGGVRAAERAQAFPAAASAGAAGGAGRGEFGAVVRRVEGACAAARAVCGRGSRLRSRDAADLVAVHGLAACRPDRSGGGAGGHSGPPRFRSAHRTAGLGRVGESRRPSLPT